MFPIFESVRRKHFYTGKIHNHLEFQLEDAFSRIFLKRREKKRQLTFSSGALPVGSGKRRTVLALGAVVEVAGAHALQGDGVLGPPAGAIVLAGCRTGGEGYRGGARDAVHGLHLHLSLQVGHLVGLGQGERALDLGV